LRLGIAPLLAGFVFCTLTGIARVHAQAEGDVPIVGDVGLLEQVRQAHANGPRRFLRGRMVAECRHENHEATRAEVTWDGDLARWEFELVTHEPSGPRPPRKEVLIRGRSEMVHYFERSGRVHRKPLQPQRPVPAFLEHMLPRHWYSFQDLRPWHEVLQPVRRANEQLKAIEVSMRNGAIHIVRDSPGGMGMTIEASPDHDYLITRYSTRASGQGLRFKGESAWRRDTDGSIILDRLAWWRSDLTGKYATEASFSLRILEFSQLATVPSSQFTLSSLTLPRGTEILSHDAQWRVIRTDYHGGRVPPDLEKTLRDLADELRRGHLLNKGD
jgi:hypothetical protein